MELRQMRYFLAVAEEQNISAAARRLNISQPALSRQIKALEDDLGWKLISRGSQSISLTEAGRVVADEGAKMVARFDRGLENMRRQIDGVTIRIGYAPSLASEILGQTLASFSQIHPQVRVDLLDMSSVEMEAALLDGRVDLVIGVTFEAANVSWRPLCQLGGYLAMGKNHPLVGEDKVSAEQLSGQKILMYCKSDYPSYWDQVTEYFQSQKIDAKVAGEFDGITSLTAAIEAGLGVAMVADSTRFGGANIVVKRLNPAPKPLPVAVGMKEARESRSWVEAFVETLQAVATHSA